MKRILKLITTTCLALCLIFSICGRAYADYTYRSSDYVSVTKNKSYNKDGKYWMSFNLKCTTLTSSTVAFSAKLLNSSGKAVITWKAKEFSGGHSETLNFGTDFSKLSSGSYTFILTAALTYNSMSSTSKPSWNWKYTITHKSSSTVSFKGYEKVLNDEGEEQHKFTIGCKNAKGKTVILRIFDSNGQMVTLIEGPTLKSNDTSVWFKWNGYMDIGSGYKCTSGEYTVQAYFHGQKEVIEKTYNLRIH